MRSLCLALAAAALYPAAASAEAPTIQHTAVKCIVAGKYPKLEASFAPSPVARARSYFRPEGVPSWYYVEMAAEPASPAAYAGVLPKPTKKLVGQKIEYYLEASSKSFDTGRTLEYGPRVVAREEDCKEQPIAAYASGPPAGVFPNLPEGFAIAGTFPVAAVAIVGGGAAAATTVVVLKDDESQPPNTSVTQPPIVVPPPTPTPVPVTTPAGFQVNCQAQPRQGVAPLRVLFNASASGGTGVYDFAWTFGDGETSNQVSPGHTYQRAGTYQAIVTVTSGTFSGPCERSIVVDPLITDQDLTVVRTGTGVGVVTGPGIDCGSDCVETFTDGTLVDLVAEAFQGSSFDGWGGDCSGTGACRVSMSQARTVTAAFNVIPVLTVSRAGSGASFAAVTGPGINCGTDCTETYASGTNVPLQPSPLPSAPPLEFVGWSGDCSGSGACNVLMNGAKAVVATWERLFTVDVEIDTFRGHVESDDGGIDCGGAGAGDCSQEYRSGTTVTLRGEGNPDFFFSRWTDDCAAFATNPVCTLSMTTDHLVGAVFSGTPTRPDGTSVTPPAGAFLRWSSQLDVEGGWGRVTSNGSDVGAAGVGTTTLSVATRTGANRVEAQLAGSTGKSGSWRFELLDRGRLEPGSLHVLEGQVLLVTEDAIVFRLDGRAGERVAFTFRTRG